MAELGTPCHVFVKPMDLKLFDSFVMPGDREETDKEVITEQLMEELIL